MGRVIMYGVIAVLAVFVLSVTFAVQHGGESIASVRDVTVHDLTTNPDRFEGNPVTTMGRLRYSQSHERFQIVAAGNFALVIRDYRGHASLEELEGRIVRVSGVFGFDDEFGVYLDADYVVEVTD